MAGTCAPPPPLLPPLLPPPLPLRLQTSPARRRRRCLRIPATGWAAGGWVRHRGRGGLWRRLAAPRPSSACGLGASARGQGVAEAAKHVNMAAMAEESPSIWQNGMPPHRAARSCKTGALCPHASLLWSFHVALRNAAHHNAAQHSTALPQHSTTQRAPRLSRSGSTCAAAAPRTEWHRVTRAPGRAALQRAYRLGVEPAASALWSPTTLHAACCRRQQHAQLAKAYYKRHGEQTLTCIHAGQGGMAGHGPQAHLLPRRQLPRPVALQHLQSGHGSCSSTQELPAHTRRSQLFHCATHTNCTVYISA